jgi:glycosyltransferase involved in cell wall biosynthesis
MAVIVIIPAYNEALSIGKVVTDIPKDIGVSDILVVNNASTDDTERVAAEAGAIVLFEKNKGYGNACLKGMEYIAQLPKEKKPQVVVFLDGDYSDYPEDMRALVKDIFTQKYDMVLGSRVLGSREKGALTPQQVFGNWLATTLVRWIYGIRYSDLGPFRAIRYTALLLLNMQDKNYGWTMEMQIKAAKMGLKIQEIPVRYRHRIGVSKVSGTLKGAIMAGYKILWTVAKYI